MSSDLRLRCMISYVVIRRRILPAGPRRTVPMRGPHTGGCTRATDGEGDCQGVIMSQTRGTMYTTWRSISLVVASKRPRVTLCGAPGRDVRLEPVVDGLGSATDLRVIDIPTKLARGQCPRFRRKHFP